MNWIPEWATVYDWTGPLDYVALFRLALAALLGAGIGWERERHGRAAGLRTHLLLCTGCALIMLVSIYLPALFMDLTAEHTVRIDPSRIASQTLAGLGFLGAGAILVLGQHIRGLTTAACVWVTAAIGLCVGAGYLLPALFTWGLALFALLVVGKWEHTMVRKDQYVGLDLYFARAGRFMDTIRRVLEGHGIAVLRYSVDREGDAARYHMVLRYVSDPDFEALAADLSQELTQCRLEKLEWGTPTRMP